MAPTITATPETSPADVPRVRISVAGVVAAQVTVSRLDPSGRWVAVRAADPANVSGSTTVFDYEAPYDLPVHYRVVDGSTTVESADVTLTTDGVPWLIHPGKPETSVPLSVIEWPTWKHPIERGVFSPIGRRNRVVVGSARQSPEGDLVVYTAGHDTTDRLDRILADGTTLLLGGTTKEHAGTRWVSIGEVTQQPVEVDLKAFTLWTLPLVEVDRPEGLAVAAATYADATAAFTSYGAATTQAPTYEDRTAHNY